MNSHSTIPELIQRTKALAALDLILSPEWEYRYYSFNAVWAPSEQMASMRDGCGDEWWMVFHSDGWAALKGLTHESEAWSKGRDLLSRAIQGTLPSELASFAHEPAFRWDATSFAYFYLPSEGRWTLCNDATQFSKLDAGEEELLRHLDGSPSDYVTFAADYHEVNISLDIVSQVFDHEVITEAMVSSLNPQLKLNEIAKELHTEIGYPRPL